MSIVKEQDELYDNPKEGIKRSAYTSDRTGGIVFTQGGDPAPKKNVNEAEDYANGKAEGVVIWQPKQRR